MAGRTFSWHGPAYWILMCLCLVSAAYCVLGGVMNSSFAVAAEDPTSFTTAARYWYYGALGFVLLAIACGLKASLVRRKSRDILGRAL